MSDFSTYRSMCSIPTLAETIQRHVSGASNMTVDECQALVDEAKAATPPTCVKPSDRAKWIAKYIKKTLAKRAAA